LHTQGVGEVDPTQMCHFVELFAGKVWSYQCDAGIQIDLCLSPVCSGMQGFTCCTPESNWKDLHPGPWTFLVRARRFTSIKTFQTCRYSWLHVYVRKYVHASCMSACMRLRTYIHTYIHACKQACMHMHTDIQTYRHTGIHTHIRTHTHTNTHCTHTKTHTNTYMHACMHAYTHRHT
jgi:hypothetical protein